MKYLYIIALVLTYISSTELLAAQVLLASLILVSLHKMLLIQGQLDVASFFESLIIGAIVLPAIAVILAFCGVLGNVFVLKIADAIPIVVLTMLTFVGAVRVRSNLSAAEVLFFSLFFGYVFLGVSTSEASPYAKAASVGTFIFAPLAYALLRLCSSKFDAAKVRMLIVKALIYLFVSSSIFQALYPALSTYEMSVAYFNHKYEGALFQDAAREHVPMLTTFISGQRYERLATIILDPITASRWFAAAAAVYLITRAYQSAGTKTLWLPVGMSAVFSILTISRAALVMTLFITLSLLIRRLSKAGLRPALRWMVVALFMTIFLFLAIGRGGENQARHLESYHQLLPHLSAFGYGIGSAGQAVLNSAESVNVAAGLSFVRENFYSGLLAQLGIVGAILWMALNIVILKTVSDSERSLRLPHTASIALSSMFVMAIFTDSIYSPSVSALLFACGGLFVSISKGRIPSVPPVEPSRLSSSAGHWGSNH